MNVGDRVRVKEMSFSPENYPFLPNLLGAEGVIFSIDQINDEDFYEVKFDQKFKNGVIPPGTTAFGFQPTEWIESDVYMLGEDELEKI